MLYLADGMAIIFTLIILGIVVHWTDVEADLKDNPHAANFFFLSMFFIGGLLAIFWMLNRMWPLV